MVRRSVPLSGRRPLPSASRFGLQAPCVQGRLCVAVGLRAAVEDEIARRLERHRILEVRRHRPIQWIPRVLLVHHGCHAPHGLHNLRLAGDAVIEPVGDVLARDPQRAWSSSGRGVGATSATSLAQVLEGTPAKIGEALLSHLGVDQAKKVVRALDKRLRNVKPDCLACRGTGFAPVRFTTACGIPLFGGNSRMKSIDEANALLKKAIR